MSAESTATSLLISLKVPDCIIPVSSRQTDKLAASLPGLIACARSDPALDLQFESQARELVSQLPWVKDLKVKMTAQAPKPMTDEDVPPGLRKVANIIAVSSCKVCTGLLHGGRLSCKQRYILFVILTPGVGAWSSST